MNNFFNKCRLYRNFINDNLAEEYNNINLLFMDKLRDMDIDIINKIIDNNDITFLSNDKDIANFLEYLDYMSYDNINAIMIHHQTAIMKNKLSCDFFRYN